MLEQDRNNFHLYVKSELGAASESEGNVRQDEKQVTLSRGFSVPLQEASLTPGTQNRREQDSGFSSKRPEIKAKRK